MLECSVGYVIRKYRSYSLPFKIPESMLSGQWPYGTYTVRAFTGMSTVNVTFSIAAPTGRSRHLR